MKNIAIIFSLLFVALLFFPLANLLGLTDQNDPILLVPGQTEQFAKVSNVLQNKCVDCHAPGMMRGTLYSDLPYAKQLIKQDIDAARERLVLTEQHLSGEKAFTPLMLARIEHVISQDAMPPMPYQLMHWTSGIAENEKALLLDWVKQQRVTAVWSQDNAAEFKAEPIQALPLLNAELNTDKVALGKKLFHERLLSGDETLSCASCHALTKGGTDQAKVATGIHGQQGPINAPTVYAAMYNLAQFWDSRAKDLTEQAAGPVANPKEMGAQWVVVVEKLKQVPEYQTAFAQLYPSEGLTKATVTDAIAQFEKSLLSPNSRFDQYLRGNTAILTTEEKSGYALFKTYCSSCHFGPVLGGQSYEKIGVKQDYFATRLEPLTEADNGRYNVTKLEKDRYFFKVPVLRNVELTYPYFHDGSVDSLAAAVEVMGSVQAGKSLNSSEIADLVAFLKSLTGEYQGKSLLGLKAEDVQ